MKNNHRSGALDISALHLLHRAGQCAEVLFTNETGKADLTPRQYAILASVAQNPDISQTGLVEQTGVDRSTLADIVRRLVKKGLLQRKRTRRDARMYAVRLTAKGTAALSAIKPAAARVDQRLLSVLAAGPARRLHRVPRRDRQGHEPPRRRTLSSGQGPARAILLRRSALGHRSEGRTAELRSRRTLRQHHSGYARSTMARVSAQSRPWP